jgi:hypothetical protein
MMVFNHDLLVQRLDQVTCGNQSDQGAALDHGQLPDMVLGHLAHGFGQGRLRAAGNGVGGLDVLDELVREPFGVVMVPENHVTLGEDPQQISCGAGDGQCTDVVFHKQTQCLLDRGLGSDGNYRSSLRLEYIADEHRGPPFWNRLAAGPGSRYRLSSTLIVLSGPETASEFFYVLLYHELEIAE